MNNDRRKEIGKIKDRLEEAAAALEDIKSDVESLRDEEQEYFDNMPESFHNADKGQVAQDAITELDNAISAIDDFDVADIVNNLETASE